MVNSDRMRALLAARFITGAVVSNASVAEDIGRAALRIAEMFEKSQESFTQEETLECRKAIDLAFEWGEKARKAYVDEIASCFVGIERASGAIHPKSE